MIKKSIVPRWIRRGILYTFRKPMTYFIKSWDRDIPKVALTEKHIRNLKVLTDRYELLKQLPSHAIVAELGVDQGDFSEMILQLCEPQKLHLVDFWGSRRYNEIKQKHVFNKFSAQQATGQVEINLGLSTDVARTFQDNYFDWIYIDTDHTYKTTKEELELYRSKMKPGGIIAGHDYSIGSWQELRRYGVIEAVHEFCVKYDWEMVYLTMDIHSHPSFAIRRSK